MGNLFALAEVRAVEAADAVDDAIGWDLPFYSDEAWAAYNAALHAGFAEACSTAELYGEGQDEPEDGPWEDEPSDVRFFDEEAQVDLRLHEALFPDGYYDGVR